MLDSTGTQLSAVQVVEHLKVLHLALGECRGLSHMLKHKKPTHMTQFLPDAKTALKIARISQFAHALFAKHNGESNGSRPHNVRFEWGEITLAFTTLQSAAPTLHSGAPRDNLCVGHHGSVIALSSARALHPISAA